MFKQERENISIEVIEIRALSKLSPVKSLVAMLSEWLIIAVAIAASEYFNRAIVYLLAWIIIGSRMYALYSLLHDGIHYLLHPNKAVNDWICRLFLAWPLFISLDKMRKFHLAHHQHLKTTDDPEAVHLEYPEFQFPKAAPVLAFTFLKDITGFNFIFYKTRKALLYIFRSTSGNVNSNLKNEAPADKYETQMLSFYLLISCVLILTGIELKFILYWIVPYVTVYQLLNRLRLTTEHFHLPEEKLLQTRTVKLNLPERVLFSPHNLGYHAEHHLYPSVPFYRLPILHEKLMQTISFRNNVVLSKSYFRVIKEYIK